MSSVPPSPCPTCAGFGSGAGPSSQEGDSITCGGLAASSDSRQWGYCYPEPIEGQKGGAGSAAPARSAAALIFSI